MFGKQVKVGPNFIQRALQIIPATRPGSWLLARILHRVDPFLMRVSRGRVSLPSVLVGLPVVMMTMTGAKSGRRITLPLAAIPHGDAFALIASNFGNAHNPAWYYNLRAHPHVEVTRAGRTATFVAREATGAEYATWWTRANEFYLGYAAYKKRAGARRIPILVLTPRHSA